MNIDVKRLTVTYNQRIVGYLVEIEPNRMAFQYDEQWVSDGFSISPLSLPLSHQVYISKSDMFGGLFGVFNDSLPDGWGALLVRRMLARQGIRFEHLSPLSKLTLVSDKGLGALGYEPTAIHGKHHNDVTIERLAQEVQRILDETYEDADLDSLYHYGGSSGGARPKAHLQIDGEDWIVKFPATMDPPNVGASEYKSNMLAKKAGILVPECRLFPSKRYQGFFGVKRFDRSQQEKKHMISLAAILETTHQIPNLDYIHLFQVIQKISIDQDDLYEAYRRMCFNVLHQNKDDHSKNHAFLYDEKAKGYRLSPAFDLTRTPYKVEHEMTVAGEGKPTEMDLIRFSKVFKLSAKRCEQILNHVKESLTESS
jgi:serine/threonine-protein kinase HipA